MENSSLTRITKSDFLLYCEAPRHLWAKKHGQIEVNFLISTNIWPKKETELRH